MEAEEHPQKRNSRVAVGCTACRVRHVRCDKEMPSCSACIKAGIECERTLHVRFRPNLGPSAGYEFSSDQVWVRPTKTLEYRDETSQVSRIYETDKLQDSYMEEAIMRDLDSMEVDHLISTSPAQISSASNLSRDSHRSISPTTRRDELIRSPGNARPTCHLLDSSELYRSPASTYSRPALPFTTREAVLIRNFAENMALWADATDLKRHFELEVPRRSMYFPVLRYAVFAFSSRHINRDKLDTSTEALEYYDHCLSLLIEAVGESNGPIDEETLAAIAILRQYEEMDADDMEMHLTGTSRIVNSMSLFDFNGGLGEAAAWLCLRQDIYVSLTKQRPLRSHLETYKQSDVFRCVDDAAYANRMVFLLAKALSCIFSTDSSYLSDELESIKYEIDNWFDSKPAAFNPILEKGRNKDEGRLLPEIWVLSPFHAVGLQYYHIAKVVLEMSTSIVTASVFEQIRQCKKVEVLTFNPNVLASLTELANCAKSFTTTRHSISVWGSVFTEQEDKEMVLTFLELVQQKTGWYTVSLSSALRQRWTQDAEEH
ncbi:hypothetical protein FGRMN_11168 [Fusarium graminum]|nr:hypothetical protein FGRMN_11168 [Fusarium graminum]